MTDIVDRLRLTNADFLHEEAADEIERLRAERDRMRKTMFMWLDAWSRHSRHEQAEAERDRLRNLLSLAEAKLSEGRLYVGYGNAGPLHDQATASIIQRARAALGETSHD